MFNTNSISFNNGIGFHPKKETEHIYYLIRFAISKDKFFDKIEFANDLEDLENTVAWCSVDFINLLVNFIEILKERHRRSAMKINALLLGHKSNLKL